MTVIVQPEHVYASKATLKAALDRGDCTIHEPSVMGSWTKFSRDIQVGFSDSATRMRRDKFCRITKLPNGTWKVE